MPKPLRSSADLSTQIDGNEEFKSIIDRIDGLPTISLVAGRVGELVNDPDSTAKSIAEVLRTDQSLSAKVLKLVNSPYYAIPGGVSDVTRAISFLGFNTLYQLVLSVSVISALAGDYQGDLKPRELWRHALACAVMAKIIAEYLGHPEPEVCYTAGLLHDIGKVALLQTAPFQFQEAVAHAREKMISIHDAVELKGLPNPEAIGARLAERWRFPMPIRVGILHRSNAKIARSRSVAKNMHTFADVVALANVLVRRYGIGDPGDDHQPDIDKVILERLNMSDLAVEDLRGELMRVVERSNALLDLVT